MKLRKVTDAEKARMWEKVREEFPGDAMMQELHFVRLLHQRQTEGFSSRELIQFYARAKKATRV
jgi:hypothetical protein